MHKSQLVFGATRAQLAISSHFSLDVPWQACIHIKTEEVLVKFDDFARSRYLWFLRAVLQL